MHPTRRHLLAGLLGAGGLAALAGSLAASYARADSVTPTDPDRYFVFVYFFGGWDVLLCLDPRHPDEFNESNLADTGILPAYGQQSQLPGEMLIESGGLTFGPFIGELARHAERMAVVRGMAMESVAHIVGQRHANTGRAPAGTSPRGSSLATILASLLGKGETIPNLAAGIESFNIGQPLWASGLGAASIDDLYDALTPGSSSLGVAERDALDRFFEEERARARSSWVREALENRQTSRAIVDEGIADFFDLDQDSAEMLALRDRFGIDSGTTGSTGPLALMAGQALTKGVSRCVTIRGAQGLDAHSSESWQREHGPALMEGFDAVAALIDHLAETPFGDGSSWLDHTTFVLQSEFSRTPALNSAGGRDHHITNSAALLGAGIRGGMVAGGSSDFALGAQAVDLATGALDSGGEFIGNEHIARALLHSIGVTEDVADLRTNPLLGVLA